MKITKQELTDEELVDIKTNIVLQVHQLLDIELGSYHDDIVYDVTRHLVESLNT